MNIVGQSTSQRIMLIRLPSTQSQTSQNKLVRNNEWLWRLFVINFKIIIEEIVSHTSLFLEISESIQVSSGTPSTIASSMGPWRLSITNYNESYFLNLHFLALAEKFLKMFPIVSYLTSWNRRFKLGNAYVAYKGNVKLCWGDIFKIILL